MDFYTAYNLAVSGGRILNDLAPDNPRPIRVST